MIKFRQNKNGTTTFITALKLKPYEIDQGHTYEERNNSLRMHMKWVAPLLKFRVIDSTQTAFKVITNENTNEFFFIKREPERAYYKSEKEWRDKTTMA